MIDDTRRALRRQGIVGAVRRHDTAKLFDWLMTTLSYQGIADRVARDYLDQHGSVTWEDIETSLEQDPTCPKLAGYWRFFDCRYEKGRNTCAEPSHRLACPLPHHQLRNGRLNQTAYSLFLFLARRRWRRSRTMDRRPAGSMRPAVRRRFACSCPSATR